MARRRANSSQLKLIAIDRQFKGLFPTFCRFTEHRFYTYPKIKAGMEIMGRP